MNNLSITLKDLRTKRGLTQEEIARLLGMRRSAYANYERGERQPDFETLEIIADFFNVSLDKLLGREKRTPHLVPVLGQIAAGLPITAQTDILDYEEITPELASSGEIFGLKVRGQSMEPMFLDGDTVLLRAQPTANNGDIAAVLINGNEATLKKFYMTDSGTVKLIALNQTYDSYLFTADEVKSLPVSIIGVVVELRRTFHA